MPISRAYALCGVQRCGSTPLCRALTRTGVAGDPQEYFWNWREAVATDFSGDAWVHWAETPWAREDSIGGWERFARELKLQKSSPNGVFGVQIMAAYLDELLTHLRALSNDSASSDVELIGRWLPDCRYIRIVRRDKVRQAVSWAIADQTGIYNSIWPLPPRREPAFDPRMIDDRLERILRDEYRWDRFFSDHGIQPLTLFYENFMGDFGRAVREVLDYLEIEHPKDVSMGPPPLEKQSSDVNDEWVERYLKWKRPPKRRLSRFFFKFSELSMLRKLLAWSASGLDELTRRNLTRERCHPSDDKPYRVLVTVCRSFPIYSQTFVYRELTELARGGFDLCLLYSKRESRSHLHEEFGALWQAKRRDNLISWSGSYALENYRRRMPETVARLAGLVSEASGIDTDALFEHKHFRQAFAFTRLAEAWAPDYLHSYFFYERSLMALVASYLLGIPRGVTCYADHVLDDYELKVVPLHMKLSDVVIATSERVRRELLQIAPDIAPERVLLKPNAIAASEFPAGEHPDPPPGSPFHIVCTSRIEPKKGLLVAVEAMAALRERGVSALLHLVGEPDDTATSRNYDGALRRRIAELDIGQSVRLEGRQDLDGVRRFLASAHLFVAPFVELDNGDKDGIPTALLEAMAAGLMPIVTDAGSMLEVVEGGKNGIVVPQRDPKALADAIEAMLHDPGRRRKLGSRAADKARGSFDVASHEKIFHERVRQVLAARRGS